MGECLILRSGGMDTSDATAQAGHILTGYTAYVNDALVSGSMANRGTVNQSLNCSGSYTIATGWHSGSGKVTANALSGQTGGTASAGNILSGKTAWVNGSKITGTITNRGSVSQSLNPGGSYTIPSGWHSGSGKVTVTSLSANTSATASAGNILSGKTAWVNGSKITGSMANKGAATHSLTANGSYTIAAGWHNGSGKVTQSLTTQAATTITPGTSAKTAVAAGRWTTGTITVAGSSSLVAGNIKKGVNIFGVVGSAVEKPAGFYLIQNGAIQNVVSWELYSYKNGVNTYGATFTYDSAYNASNFSMSVWWYEDSEESWLSNSGLRFYFKNPYWNFKTSTPIYINIKIMKKDVNYSSTRLWFYHQYNTTSGTGKNRIIQSTSNTELKNTTVPATFKVTFNNTSATGTPTSNNLANKNYDTRLDFSIGCYYRSNRYNFSIWVQDLWIS